MGHPLVGTNFMHPYWIQKIEESRKTSVTKFWVTLVLIIVIPLLLVLKHDGFLVIGVACFAAAGLRYYWLGRELPVKPKDQLPLSADLKHTPGMSSGPQLQTNASPNTFSVPQGVPTTPEFQGTSQHPGVIPSPVGAQTNPFLEQAQTGQFVHDQRATGQFLSAPAPSNGMPTQFSGDVPANPFPAPEQTLATHSAVTTAAASQNVAGANTSQKPLHFHDVAR